MENLSFRTKARTVDHLGREQIADCPTAVSELWKNAFDAYARRVELQIFDTSPTSAAIFDDGVGMSKEDFIDRWLVVGTEGKLLESSTQPLPRQGFQRRPKQGRKGIGRLSCANLGPVLLLVSKKIDSGFVAALVDWRLFENPFLDLSDISIPVVDFESPEDLEPAFAEMCAGLLENFGLTDPEPDEVTNKEAWETRQRQRRDAWSKHDDLKPRSGPDSIVIQSSLHELQYPEQVLEKWSIWNGGAQSGTALVIFQATYDLEVFASGEDDESARQSKDKFHETLSSFIDPFVSSTVTDISDLDFTYGASVWTGSVRRTIVSPEKNIKRRETEEMEHVLEGRINKDGIFTGRVRAFGEEREVKYVIPAPKALRIPDGPTTHVGPVHLYLAAFERDKKNSTHSETEHAKFSQLADGFSGLLIFRDGLRVMPYGRTDNDFFEIDDRRSRNAGREFWNNRRMFGRLAISQTLNPNLRDKAGREGILDNVAAKTLKTIVANILQRSARDYFGSSSELRKTLLPEIQESNRQDAAREQRRKLRKKNTGRFRHYLKEFSEELPSVVEELNEARTELVLNTVKDLDKAQEVLAEIDESLTSYRLVGAPKSLGTQAERYEGYKYQYALLHSLRKDLASDLVEAINELDPPDPSDVFNSQVARIAGRINRRIGEWKDEVEGLQREEYERFRDLVSTRRKLAHELSKPFGMRLETDDITFPDAMAALEDIRQRIEAENATIFPPYLRALESLSDGIDLDLLASTGTDAFNSLQADFERLTGLAQLGIAVEIVGHELDAYDDMIGEGLRQLPDDMQLSPAVQDIRLGYEGLTDQLRFLSPLKLSGQRVERWITGVEIDTYIREFFDVPLRSRNVDFQSSETFRRFRILEQPSRILPVFINLMNNALYWVRINDGEEVVRLDIDNEEIVMSDNGPGVDLEDVDKLFSLFYTTRMKGGRGVGLYLCRANLGAGGHSIRYRQPKEDELPGAHFAIRFNGMEIE